MYSVNTSNNIIDTNTYDSTYSSAPSNIRNTPLTNKSWLKLASVENHKELSSKYADICHQHEQEKKWVLFINPEESSLEQLANVHGVDISKVLCVSFKGKNKINNLLDEKSAHLDIEQIQSVLSRGNCSAVILSNASFSTDEITALDSSARLGETQCVLLRNNRKTQILLNNQQVH